MAQGVLWRTVHRDTVLHRTLGHRTLFGALHAADGVRRGGVVCHVVTVAVLLGANIFVWRGIHFVSGRIARQNRGTQRRSQTAGRAASPIAVIAASAPASLKLFLPPMRRLILAHD